MGLPFFGFCRFGEMAGVVAGCGRGGVRRPPQYFCSLMLGDVGGR